MFEDLNFETWHLFFISVLYLVISYLLGIEGLAQLFYREESVFVPYTRSEKREGVKKGLRDIWRNQSKPVVLLAILLFALFGIIFFFISLIQVSILKNVKSPKKRAK